MWNGSVGEVHVDILFFFIFGVQVRDGRGTVRFVSVIGWRENGTSKLGCGGIDRIDRIGGFERGGRGEVSMSSYKRQLAGLRVFDIRGSISSSSVSRASGTAVLAMMTCGPPASPRTACNHRLFINLG
jgi:hypothetical protein